MKFIKATGLLLLISSTISSYPKGFVSLKEEKMQFVKTNNCNSHVAVCEHDMKMYCKNCGAKLYDLYGIAAKTFEVDISGVNAGLGYVKDFLAPSAFEQVCELANNQSSIDIFAQKTNYIVPNSYPENEFPDAARNTPSDTYNDDNYDAIVTDDYYIDLHAMGKNIWFNFRVMAKLRTTTDVIKLYKNSVTIETVNDFPSKIVLCDSFKEMKSKALETYNKKTPVPFSKVNGIYYFYTNKMLEIKQ